MSNALDPTLMTATERLAEVGEILAAGLIRLRARQGEAEALGERGDVFPGLPRQPERAWLNSGQVAEKA